jgi:hypothetical protein
MELAVRVRNGQVLSINMRVSLPSPPVFWSPSIAQPLECSSVADSWRFIPSIVYLERDIVTIIHA